MSIKTGILSFIIVVQFAIIILLLYKGGYINNSATSVFNTNEKQEAVGIYHCSNWYNRDASLELRSDMTCKYPGRNMDCRWSISDNKIALILEGFIIKDENGHPDPNNYLMDIEHCEMYIRGQDNHSCEKGTESHEATLVNDGILLEEKIFTKLN